MVKICNVCGHVREHRSWKATTCNDCLKRGFKWCSGCHSVKPLVDFHKNGSTIRSLCKPCECKRSIGNKKTTGYYNRQEVKQKRNENSRLCKRAKYMFDEQYRIDELNRCHARRSSMQGHITVEQWHAACAAFDFKCAYCGAEHKLTMDHVVAVSVGGITSASNIVPACQSCNSSKQNKDLIEWYTAQPFYNKSRLDSIIKYLKGVTPCQR